MNKFKSGFVSLVGRPNAGKSTLLNALVGQKVAIVADKPQTTRTSIQGVLTLPEAQVIFIDTPGIHKADSQLNKRLMDTVRASLEERDLLLFLVDSTRAFTVEDRRALDLATHTGTPVVLVLTKVDLLPDKGKLLPLIEQYKGLHGFVEYTPVSATRKIGLDELRQVILNRLPEGPQYFPENHVTDQPERFLAAELVREKVLQVTRQEVPHSVNVMVDRWEETPNITRIYATVRVERPGQKGIVIGKKGAVLVKIGTLARVEMEKLFGVKIYLDLHVRVQPGWREKAAFLNTLDWRTMAVEDDS
ncbi:MAG TPA: GTPase Era [Bryobacteraceae bacterium]|jgi:GTP-binding protein Era|nr:GTPase Era [Bryobacteraceae bacterium]